MGSLVWSNYLVWTFADVTDSSDNVNEMKACRVLVQTDLPSVHQNNSPKPVRRKEESADFKYNIQKVKTENHHELKEIMHYVLLDAVCIKTT